VPCVQHEGLPHRQGLIRRINQPHCKTQNSLIRVPFHPALFAGGGWGNRCFRLSSPEVEGKADTHAHLRRHS
jgi:hypothetical protein